MKDTLHRRLSRLAKLGSLSTTCTRLALSGQKQLLPQAIYTGFRELGGVYVKFLQLMVLRSEAFQSLREYDIYDVYDRVNVEEVDIRDFLQKELGDRAGDIQLVSDTPFAAGSFGQVYLAGYQGKKIIIKVLRPSVASDLRFDLRVLGLFSRCIDLITADSPINSRRVHKEFSRTSLLETNYILEADYATKLYDRYRNHPNIHIPFTYRELCGEQLICQDYVDGIPATDLVAAAKEGLNAEAYIARELGSDLKQQLVALGSEMLISIFKYGTAYGDPHPGNLKFMPDNKIGLIDFGLQAPAPRNTLNFYRLIEQYYKIYSGQTDLRGCSQVLLDMYGGDVIRAAHSLDHYEGSNRLLDYILNNAEQIMQNQGHQIDHLVKNNKILQLFNLVINKDNRFCLEYDLDGPEIMRAGLMSMWLADRLGVKQEVLRETYGRVLAQTRDVALREGQPELHPETALEILAGWFDQISYKNPQLYRQLKLGGFKYV
jgi:serine/threonine protein kinase